MKNTYVKILLHATYLLATIACTVVGLEIFLFKLASYNVYRVLDISFQNILAILFFLAVQYLLLGKIPAQLSALWETSKTVKNKWLLFLAISLLSAGLFSLLPIQTPFWILFPLLIGFVGFSFFIVQLTRNPFQKNIFLLLFGAVLNASLIFWMHEETNEGRHLQYAQQLAEREDTIAETQLMKLADLAKENPDKLDDKFFWEKRWLDDDYLSSNYRLSIDTNKTDSTASNYQPILTFDDSSTPVYHLHFPNDYTLSFKLKKDFKRSVYTTNQPYKNLTRLSNYHFAVVDHQEVVLANSHDFDLNILNVQLPPIGKGEKIEWNGFDVAVYHHTDQVYVIIGEPLSEVQVWVSNFAFFLSLFIIVALLLEFLILFFSKERLYTFWQNQPIQFRIQATLIGLTLLLFFVIASTTFNFLQQNNQELAYERQLYIAETVQKAIFEDQNFFNWSLVDFPASRLAELAERKQCEIDVYNQKGELVVSSIATAKNSPAQKILEEDIQKKIQENPSAIMVIPFEKNKETCLRSVFSVMQKRDLEGFVAINTFESEIGTAQDIPIIMSKLLNVYVFLLLITWGGGLMLIDLLTQPLQLLANRLGSFKPGKQNEKLNWAGNDAIGKLIGEYNKMVDVVEQTTKELAQSEREGAWQIMAQQIAHEINNTLTPLRLNIQFLTRMLEDPKTIEPESAKRITNRLVDQIDLLAGVASQFKLFAKLETPETKPLDVKPFLEQFFNQYKKQERLDYKFISNLENGTKPIVHIDTQHFQQILQNIIKNAENAIPENREGEIILRLNETDDRVVIEIEDNGDGIDTHVVEHIFDPKFSTNSSNTGLGLPICRRIVEFYKGDLSFTTQPGKGTCFKISFSDK